VRLAAVRRLAYEASDTGLLSPDPAAGIRRVKGAKRLGVRIGNWLTVHQSRILLGESPSDSLRGKRDRAILALLIGCGLRRAELVGLGREDFQVREEHWVIADLIGKGKHIRTVPVPMWAKRAVDEWTTAAAINGGAIFRRVNRLGKIWGDGITPKAIWHIVKAAAKRVGIRNLAPHDLRRTCARLCHLAGGELEQIQFLLGHASVLRHFEDFERDSGRRSQTSAGDCGWDTGGASSENGRRSVRFEFPANGFLGRCLCSVGGEDHEENRWRLWPLSENGPPSIIEGTWTPPPIKKVG